MLEQVRNITYSADRKHAATHRSWRLPPPFADAIPRTKALGQLDNVQQMSYMQIDIPSQSKSDI